MSLGERNAKAKHERGIAKEAIVSADYWLFQPGEKVMTCDGLPGVVANVYDGPFAGSEEYQVTLDNGLGGGSYTSSQLSPLGHQTASVEHTAADDYPELGAILVDRPDPATEIVTLGSLHTANANCPNCGGYVGWGHDGDICHGCGSTMIGSDAGQLPDRISADCPECGYYSGSGHEDPCPQCGSLLNHKHHPQVVSSQQQSYEDYDGDDEPAEGDYHIEHGNMRHGGVGWNVTQDNHQHGGFRESPNGYGRDEGHDAAHAMVHDHMEAERYYPNVHCTEDAGDPAHHQESVAAHHQNNQRRDDEEDLGEHISDMLPHGDLLVDNPTGPSKYSALDTDHFSNYSRGIKSATDAYSDDFARLTDGGMHHNHCEEKAQARYPGHQSEGISFHELRTKMPHGATCDECMDHITEPRPHSASECEYGEDCEHFDPQEHASKYREEDQHGLLQDMKNRGIDPDHKPAVPHLSDDDPLHDHFGSDDDLHAEQADQSHWEDTYHQRKSDEESAGHQIDQHFSQPEHSKAVDFLDHNTQGPSHYSMLVLAATDPDFRFHITAAWKDVQAKAKRLRKEGFVKVVVATASHISAEVKGDHHTYETELQYVPGSKKVAIWSCGCKWGAYSWGRSGRWKRYEGRMCSHALATQFEAQSRGMFGKDVSPDSTRPVWQRAHQPVVVQYDRTDKENITRRTVPPGNMKRTFGSLEREAMDIVDWKKFDAPGNHAYRSGVGHGVEGRFDYHDEIMDRHQNGQHPLDDYDLDYLAGHMAGTERGRDNAADKHRMEQVWKEHGTDYHTSMISPLATLIRESVTQGEDPAEIVMAMIAAGIDSPQMRFQAAIRSTDDPNYDKFDDGHWENWETPDCHYCGSTGHTAHEHEVREGWVGDNPEERPAFMRTNAHIDDGEPHEHHINFSPEDLDVFKQYSDAGKQYAEEHGQAQKTPANTNDPSELMHHMLTAHEDDYAMHKDHNQLRADHDMEHEEFPEDWPNSVNMDGHHFHEAKHAAFEMNEEDPGGGNGAGDESGEDEAEQMGDGTGMGLGGLGNAAASLSDHRCSGCGDRMLGETVDGDEDDSESPEVLRCPTCMSQDDAMHSHGMKDDEYLFEPPIQTEAAFLAPLLEAAPELLAGGEAAGGAAEGEEGGGLLNTVKKHLTTPHPKSPAGHQGGDTQAPQIGGQAGTPSIGADYQVHFGTFEPVPEGALPETDGAEGMDPERDQAESTGDPETMDVTPSGSGGGAAAASLAGMTDAQQIAYAARQALSATAMKVFSPQEQASIINEGEGVKAANLDRLSIEGTHYEALEAALGSDEDDEWY